MNFKPNKMEEELEMKINYDKYPGNNEEIPFTRDERIKLIYKKADDKLQDRWNEYVKKKNDSIILEHQTSST